MKIKGVYDTITLLLLLTAMACHNPKDKAEIPPGILSLEQMRIVLADFALAESAAVLNVKNVPIHKVDSTYAFDPLIENNIRKTQFDSSIAYYAGNPELYKHIYDSVVVTLSQMKSQKSASVNSQSSK